MKRLQKLIDLSNYLQTFTLSQYSVQYVTSAADVTSILDKASGTQILVARPEARLSGNDSLSYKHYLSSAIFVLQKDLGAAKTAAKQNQQFDSMLTVASDVLQKIEDDMASPSCGLLAGIDLTDVSVTPETSIFGSWCGWSIELSFER